MTTSTDPFEDLSRRAFFSASQPIESIATPSSHSSFPSSRHPPSSISTSLAPSPSPLSLPSSQSNQNILHRLSRQFRLITLILLFNFITVIGTTIFWGRLTEGMDGTSMYFHWNVVWKSLGWLIIILALGKMILLSMESGTQKRKTVYFDLYFIFSGFRIGMLSYLALGIPTSGSSGLLITFIHYSLGNHFLFLLSGLITIGILSVLGLDVRLFREVYEFARRLE
ncbi:hypothetical protein BKA69DRAFT_361746 [Paraphysoderma sedebokerense]|nr:hypothetical protein BKA69DRAFT_361746 [Paraphysoderma sedebokerense]